MEECGWVTLPSQLGRWTQKIFDQYPIYEYIIPSDLIEQFLPDKLQSFAKPTLVNFGKDRFFYSKFVIHLSRSQLDISSQYLSNDTSLRDLLEYLLYENNSLVRYNIVLTGTSLIFVRVPRTRHVSYHLLAKHINLASRSNDVRFAGELWKDEHGCFRLNNSSGTYNPVDELIPSMINLLKRILPDMTFEGISYRLSALPSTKKKIREKCRMRLAHR